MVRWGETNYYAIRMEFQERGSSHVHLFIWIFSAPNIQNEAAYIDFIEKRINAQLLDQLNDPELFVLVKTYQVYAHSRTCLKYNKNQCRFSCRCYFLTQFKLRRIFPAVYFVNTNSQGERVQVLLSEK